MTLEEWLGFAPFDISPETLARIRLDAQQHGSVITRTALVETVCHAHGLTVKEVMGRSRYKSVVKCREHCCKELRRLGLSYPEIGLVMKRDHTTVMALVKGDKRKGYQRGEVAAE